MVQPPDAQQAIEHAARESGQRWPAITWPLSRFREHLETCGIDVTALRAQGAELFLAAACLAGDPNAQEILAREYLAHSPRWIARIGLPHDVRDEVPQLLWVNLLAEDSRKLAAYRGRGPLGAWVRMCALRLALDLRDSGRGERCGHNDGSILEALVAGTDDAEKLLSKESGRASIRDALREAFALLEPRERTLLRMHFLDGMSLDAMALSFRVHRATIARWMLGTKTRVLKSVRGSLKTELGGSSAEFRSLVGLLKSDIQLSVRRMLADRG